MKPEVFAQRGLYESSWSDILFEGILYQTSTIDQYGLL